MARPRKGSLIWAKSGWRARVTVDVDGEAIQQTVDLGTTNKAAARRKLARLVADLVKGSPADQAQERAKVETVATYAEAWFAGREARGVATAKGERAWFANYWADAIGGLPLGEIRSHHIRGVLEPLGNGQTVGPKGRRLSRNSLANLRAVALRIFDTAWQEELIG